MHSIIASRVVAGLFFALALVMTGPVHAQRAVRSSAVDELRRALEIPIRNPMDPADIAFRRKNVTKAIDNLRTIEQMADALSMPEGWLDIVSEGKSADIDGELRGYLAERFYKRVRALLTSDSDELQLAALTLVGAMGDVRGAGKQPGRLSRPLAPDVIRLLADDGAAVRQRSAEVLGEINADPKLAAPVLQKVIADKSSTPLRRAAARALVGLARIATRNYAERFRDYNKDRNLLEAQEFLRNDLMAMIPAVITACREGMDDYDSEVEIASAEAVTIAANALGVLVPDPFPRRDFPPAGRPWTEIEKQFIAEYTRSVEQERKELLPAAEALEQLSVKMNGAALSAIGNVLADDDAPVRLQGCKALQEASYTRWKLVQRAESVPPYEQRGLPADQDPIRRMMHNAMPDLRERILGHDPHVRLMALKAIEWLESEATPAAPTLIHALGDPDVFVRWEAIRILGDIKPDNDAVPGLARQLFDEDLDLRLAAAATLEKFGPAARAALPQLIATLNRGDPEIRIAVIEAIASQGKQATSAIPALIQALDADNAKVVTASANALDAFGKEARAAIPALQRHLEHPDAQARRAVSEALIDIISDIRTKQ